MDVTNQVSQQVKDELFQRAMEINILKGFLMEKDIAIKSFLDTLITDCGYDPQQYGIQFKLEEGILTIVPLKELFMEISKTVWQRGTS